MKRKARRWLLVGAVTALFVVLAGFALLVPHKPYNFLRNSTLQNISIANAPVFTPTATGVLVATGITQNTTRSYASEVDLDELFALASEELKPQGFTENRLVENSDTSLNYVWFQNGSVEVTLRRISRQPTSTWKLPPGWAEVIGNANTYIEVTSETTLLDRLQSKLHHDKLPTP